MKLTQKWKDESLSEDLSNNYQCYRVSITSIIFIHFFNFFYRSRSHFQNFSQKTSGLEPKTVQIPGLLEMQNPSSGEGMGWDNIKNMFLARE
jgi:hypothetical protein